VSSEEEAEADPTVEKDNETSV
jgi:hypothetical protein